MNESEGMKLAVSSKREGVKNVNAENLLCTPAEIQSLPSQDTIELYARSISMVCGFQKSIFGKEV
jgi:hypothetical protein